MAKTITEKIFAAKQADSPETGISLLRLDAVFCHEITTPPAIEDLRRRGKDRVFDPQKIKAVIDHVVPAKDSKTALQGKIMREWAARHQIKDFFDVGRGGVCHALFPEQGFVRPGMALVMGDSHTCTHGAFGAFACGVGTTDLAVAILKGVCALAQPKNILVKVNGALPVGVSAKDLILAIIRQLGAGGATGAVIEFSGETISNFSMDQRMTLCNMAIEAGGTCGVCAPDQTTVDYLWPFIKDEYDNDKAKALAAFSEWQSDAGAAYEKTLTINAAELQPVTTVGYSPDEVKPLAELSNTAINQVYVGSCTNGRLSDLREAAAILRGRHLASGVRGIVSPATSQIFDQAMAEGTLAVFREAGFLVANPTCGACLGMSCGVLAEGESCAATTNRNFSGRMGAGGMVHLLSPAAAAASGVTGHLTDPRQFL